MKRNIYLMIMLLSLTIFSSCGDFLEETSQSELVPSTVEDIKGLMYSSAYPYQLSAGMFLDLLTDDVKSNGLSDPVNYITFYENGTGVFTFNQAMFDGKITFPPEANLWKLYYGKINGCNVVKDYLDQVSGSAEEKEKILGQVLFLRAFYYMKFALAYCNIYSENAENDLGLPIVLSMYVSDDFPVRSSLQATYDQIEDDFLEAAELLEKYGVADSKFRVDHYTVYAMLSRFYLYKGRDEDLENVVKYADLALAAQPNLTSLESIQSVFQQNGIYDQSVSSEAFWVYGSNVRTQKVYYPTYSYGTITPYSVSDSLMSTFASGDLRPQSYFYQLSGTSGLFPANGAGKVGYAVMNYGGNGIRNAEVYLNRAEAKIRLAMAGGSESLVDALADLNLIRENRFSSDAYTAEEITNAEDLLRFCLEERRRELSFEEGIRWYDIKRMNLPVMHEYIDINNVSTVYRLESGDPLYALPIPNDALERNYKLEQNPK